MRREKKWVSGDWDPTSDVHEHKMLAISKVHDYVSYKTTHEFFDWQYRRNPAGTAFIRLALDRDNHDILAGQYIVIPLDFACRGRTVRGALSLNTLTDAKYRGQGVFTGLAREAYQLCGDQGVRLVIGYPNQNSYPGFLKHLEFKDVGEIPLLLRVLRLSVAVDKGFPIKSMRGVLGTMARLGNFYYRMSGETDPSVETVTEFDEAFDKFSECLMSRFPIMVKRDSAYLDWRYIQPPMEYEILVVRDRGCILGYIVYRIMQFVGMRCGVVADFVVRGDSESVDAGNRLLRSALNRMFALDCDIAEALSLPGTTERRLLRKWKFIVAPKMFLPQPFTFIVRNNALEHDFRLNIFDLHNWFVGLGDYDIV
jgi:GNAT superfamily N-acetyltransferase